MNQVQKFTTSNGRHIYNFSVQAFPGLRTNIYLISDGDSLILVDTGSGMERSNEESKAITFCWPWRKQVLTPNTSTSAAN